MKIKYGTMGIVALIVYYTIKWYSALWNAIDIIPKEEMTWQTYVSIIIAFCVPVICLLAMNDR